VVPSRVLPVVLVLAAAGCSFYHTDTLRFDQAVRPETRPDSVRVLGQEPTQPFKVVALVSASAEVGLAGGYERLTWKLAQEAAKLGGQALLLGPESITRTNGSSTLTGKVLVFEGAAPAEAAVVRRRSSTALTIGAVALLLVTTLPLLAAGGP